MKRILLLSILLLFLEGPNRHERSQCTGAAGNFHLKIKELVNSGKVPVEKVVRTDQAFFAQFFPGHRAMGEVKSFIAIPNQSSMHLYVEYENSDPFVFFCPTDRSLTRKHTKETSKKEFHTFCQTMSITQDRLKRCPIRVVEAKKVNLKDHFEPSYTIVASDGLADLISRCDKEGNVRASVFNEVDGI